MDTVKHQKKNTSALKKSKSVKNINHYTNVRGLPSIEKIVSSVEDTPRPISTQIIGTIPEWIKGNFLRNGPGKFEIGNHKFNHWVDGMALLHQFKISNGQVTYKSRFLSSDSYQTNKEHNRIAISEFGTVTMPDPCKNVFQRFLSRFESHKPTDNANMSFVTYKGDYYVSTETNIMHKVDPDTLETTEKVDWNKFIAVNGATAHPHTEPDGTTYNMGNSYTSKGSYYNIIQVPPTKKTEDETLEGATVLCSIPSVDKTKPSYYHSFAMSENYVVFIEQPIKLDLLKIMTGKLRRKSISDGLFWDPKRNTIFHLIHKHTGKVSSLKYLAKPLSTFHQINAYEEDGFLIIDLCASDDGQAITNYNIQNMRKSGEALDEVYNTLSRAFPRRFVLPLNVGPDTPYNQNLITLLNSIATSVRIAKNKVFCTHEDLHGEDLHEYGGLEFPQINYHKFNTHPYRYFYGCGFRHLVGDTLIKMDLHGKRMKVWEHPGQYPSEPVFVPSPNATEEDDGVIMSVVITPDEDKSTFLLVLDAKTFEELGRAVVPVNIPYGFHGTFNATA
ncbi:beta-carotene oxygenase 2b [Simochromis diagramma]|nr:beta-carotene oxygenase 2b [Simochromis diagramma]XP_039862345.1 beta-carotene oxygenase 2b [Simochromis diagramma]XP_039862346.1 beta-carotene oxygenase 2b [Simochromis diagramma]XP_039862348.1 beta-carotene oxygenase 2b [Simochromis diagramma]XP_039862349.1 beta-carotene oxygenase 2b [Simochromis diagramma]